MNADGSSVGVRVRILHDGAGLVAVDKPPGVPVVPAPDRPADACLRHMVEIQLGCPLWVVHRIDKDTSGLVVFARDAASHRRLCLAFEQREVSKRYVALVAGVPNPLAGVIDRRLHPARKGRMRPAGPDELGVSALTVYMTLRSWTLDDRTISLVDARPQTGRHHQIRVHLRSLGTPVLFDDVYGRNRLQQELSEGPCRRLALHAAGIDLPDVEGQTITIDAPVAPDMVALTAWLDLHWSGVRPREGATPAPAPATSWLP